MTGGTDGEVSFHRFSDLPGIEILRANDCWRSWSWLHTQYAICTPLRFEGRAEYLYRRRVHRAGPAHQAIMEPGEVHVTKLQTAPATFRVVFVDARLLVRAAEALGMGSGLPHFEEAPLEHSALLRSFRRLHECLESNVATSLERESVLAATLRKLLEVTASSGTRHQELRRPREHVQRLQEYLHDNVGASVTLDDLARAAGLSRFHVAREFKRATGVAPHAYLLLLRIERARRFLVEGASPQEAAERAGFTDASHLGRHFKRIMSVTPAAYARRTRGAPTPPAVMKWA